MSGTFGDINVPPTLIAFGIGTVSSDDVISPEFKESGDRLYLVKHTPREDFYPDSDSLKNNFNAINEGIKEKNIVAAYALGAGGLAEALAKMSFGNAVGAEVSVDEDTLFNLSYGSIVI